MAVVQDLINLALKKLAVLAEGESPTAEQSNDALTAFNDLIDHWNTQKLQSYTVTRTTWTITSGTQDYNVGSGQIVNVARPAFIDHVQFLDTSVTPNLEYQMSPLTEDAWSKVPQKGLTAPFPTSWYYNPTFPNGLISLWPKPTSAVLQGVMYAPAVVSSFATLQTAVSLAPGYKRMYVNNLAIELAPDYEREPGAALVKAAADTFSDVKRLNKRFMDMQVDAAALIQGRSRRFVYDIRTG